VPVSFFDAKLHNLKFDKDTKLLSIMNHQCSVTLTIIILLLAIFSCAPKKAPADLVGAEANIGEMTYDSLLAQKYGADEYGMKKYIMAFLYRGPNQGLDSTRKAELQRAHLQNITRLAGEKKLIVAGPFFGNGDLRGIYIFDVQSIAEAEALTNTDPAIREGSLKMELLEWYGSAGLLALEDIQKKLTRKSVVE
jgi:uncharacterized protein YciI